MNILSALAAKHFMNASSAVYSLLCWGAHVED